MKDIAIALLSFNEEQNIKNTFDEVLRAVESLGVLKTDYELIFVDDGSTDGTLAEIEKIHLNNPDLAIKIISHPFNMGLGIAFQSALKSADAKYFFWLPGEDTVPFETISFIISKAGTNSALLTYPSNIGVRKTYRQVLSKIYAAITKVLIADIRYFNGPNLYIVKDIINIKLSNTGHAFQLELISKLISRKLTYIEIPIKIKERSHGHSKAISLKNLLEIIKTVLVYRFKGKNRP